LLGVVFNRDIHTSSKLELERRGNRLSPGGSRGFPGAVGKGKRKGVAGQRLGRGIDQALSGQKETAPSEKGDELGGRRQKKKEER